MRMVTVNKEEMRVAWIRLVALSGVNLRWGCCGGEEGQTSCLRKVLLLYMLQETNALRLV